MVKIILSIPPASLSPNARVHFRTRARAVKKYKTEAAEACMAACWDEDVREPVSQATVAIRWFAATERHLDRDNALASLKTAWDAFEQAGLWRNDRDVFYLPVQRDVDPIRPRVEITVYRWDEAAWQRYLSELVEV